MREYEFSGLEFSEAGPAAGPWQPRRDGKRRSGENLVLRTAAGRFRILEIGPADCLIETSGGTGLRGRADIYEGERQVATCLITLAEPDGAYLRCAFKRRTPVRSEPPLDFAS